MKYIIMADGRGRRWNNYQGVTKHLVQINGESLLARTVRLLRQCDSAAEIIITSHNEAYDIPGAIRYAPQNNILEIDRFTVELIEDDICFLYGDTLYTQDVIETIIATETQDLFFFGNINSIVAIKIKDGELFKQHYYNVRKLYLENKIDKCIGWQVYQSFTEQDFGKKAETVEKFRVFDRIFNINSPKDLYEVEKSEELWSSYEEDQKNIS